MAKEKLSRCSQMLRTIAHPTRLMILTELAKGVKCVNDMQELLDVPQPNVSQHLAVLKNSGLVASYKEGVSRCYYLVKPGLVRALLGVLARDYPTAAPPRRKRCRARQKKMRRARGRGQECGKTRGA